jgi:hypothetical protein
MTLHQYQPLGNYTCSRCGQSHPLGEIHSPCEPSDSTPEGERTLAVAADRLLAQEFQLPKPLGPEVLASLEESRKTLERIAASLDSTRDERISQAHAVEPRAMKGFDFLMSCPGDLIRVCPQRLSREELETLHDEIERYMACEGCGCYFGDTLKDGMCPTCVREDR